MPSISESLAKVNIKTIDIPSDGAYDLVLRYASDDLNNSTRPLALKVNDAAKEPALNFPKNGSWDAKWSLVSSTQNLKAGKNTISLSSTGSSGVNIDQLEIVPRSSGISYQAETGILTGGITKKTGAKWTGKGYVDFAGGEGGITLNVDAPIGGTYHISVKYASGDPNNSSRPMQVSINNQVVEKSLAFPVNGSWDTVWGNAVTRQMLTKGGNMLKLSTTGTLGANIDEVTLTLVSADTETVTLVGDVNADNSIYSTDYAILKRYLLGMITDLPAQDNLAAGDLNGDGSIDSTDYAILKRYLLGMIDKLPFVG